MSEFQIAKKFFANGYAPNWSEEVFMISQIKNTIPLTYVINDLSGKKIDGTFYEKGIAEDKSRRIQNRKSN